MAENPRTRALINTVIAYQTSKDRPLDCPFIDWLQQQGEREPDAVRADMVARPEWIPLFSLDALERTRAPTAQAIYARALAAAPWSEARIYVERAFRDRAIALSQEAIDILVGRLATAHPNPKAFLLQAEVYEGLPPGVSVDVGALRAPDFPSLGRIRGRVSRAGRTPP